MALSKLKKFVTEEVMDENNEDEYYAADCGPFKEKKYCCC